LFAHASPIFHYSEKLEAATTIMFEETC
jgi:hypothetical protein